MKTAGTEHLIDRTYREGGPYQWVRETLMNTLEADATRVEFGVEWQAVESKGVYRRVIADNGSGMDPEELVEFFNTFGGGGKPIGGVHENFGVGAKTSLLPWNTYGVVVVSWVDGDPAMIWVERDPASGEYGLKVVEAQDPDTGQESLEVVYEPFPDEEHGCNWAAIKPDWLTDHGTVIVLLGNDPSDDTVLGDPTRSESDIKGISSYLNRRFWEVPAKVRVSVDELRTSARAQWPRTEAEAHGPQPQHGPDRRTNNRTINGARFFIEYSAPSFKTGAIKATDTMILSDGTEIEWYLWEGDRPAVQSYAAIGGYIGALYKGELYDITAHHSTYRTFGVSEHQVRSHLWLIIRPQAYEDISKHGVYPRTDRHALLLRGGPNAGGPLPFNDWGNEFAMAMPAPILDAIRASRGATEGTLDESWRQRLAERFGSRWRILKLRARPDGNATVEPTQVGGQPRPIRRKKKRKMSGAGRGTGGGSGGTHNTGSRPGDTIAGSANVGGGIPHYRFIREADIQAGMLAAWQPNDPEHSDTGSVLINVDHPVLREQIVFYQQQYADVYAEEISQLVLQTYGEIAVAKVAHSEHLKGILPTKVVEEELRSDAALTAALLGLIAEDAILATRIGGRFRKKQPAA
jgi:hypothetical protein